MKTLLLLQPSITALLLWQDETGVFRRIWFYLSKPFTFGKISVSVATLVEGILVLGLMLFLGRFLTSMLDRRMTKRAQIDPGLRYTIVRLAKYLLTTLGLILFLQI